MWSITPTIDAVEVLFTCSALFTFYAHVKNASEARLDLAALRREKRAPEQHIRQQMLMVIAEQRVRSDSIMAGVQLMFLVIGVWTMLQPPWWPVVANGPLILFLVAQGALVYLSRSRRLTREKLDRLSRRET